jgi:positive regulator of sigma E activity
MPELLTVSGIYTDNIFCGVPYILHLINLFAEKVGTLKDKKVFILCLINKAFLYSKKYRKNFILSSKYITKCPKEHSNFELLLWEINPTKRANMKKRMKWGDIVMFNKNEYDHFKAVLINYVYRHFEFLIFYDFTDEEIYNFCAFIDKVVVSNDCFVCLFNEYLEILKRQTISLKY